MRSSASWVPAFIAPCLLAGCDVRREDDPRAAEPEPAASEKLDPRQPTQRPASIIRPEVSPEPETDAAPTPLAATVSFAEGGYELDPEAERLLRELLGSAQVKRGWPVVLRGHTDSEGTDQGNIFASRKRAEAVAGWLVEHGLAESRIEVYALGEGRPVAPNVRLDGTPDEDGRRRNRRVEVWIAPPGAEPAAEMAADGTAAAEGD